MRYALPAAALCLILGTAHADDDVAAKLRDLDANVFPTDADTTRELSRTLARDARTRMQAANLRESTAWHAVKNRQDWEKFRDVRLQALRDSLGPFPPAPKDLKVRVTGTLEGDGYRIENLVFESRPGLVVTANLYAPAKPPASMPGILISHSHHAPARDGELQDMGMTWARQGCLVLVVEHFGHGERRQHPFKSEKDFPQPFRVGRQDYYFRSNEGLQLNVIGDSLIGWLAYDLMRGVDVLLARPGIDKERIILLGAVAGGGDPAAVTAALDPRIAAVVPFNFGGPQPDYSLPTDTDRDFYWFGMPEWESTRSLRLGARDGFAQWLIVASVLPRRVIYGYEFARDEQHDPAFPRLRQVADWYDAGDHLAVAAGKGSLKGSPPDSSHCNNIGPLHRGKIYPTLKSWFDMPVPDEYSKRRSADELLCLTPDVLKDVKPRSLHELAGEIGTARAAAARKELGGLTPEERRSQLRLRWEKLLGDVQPPKVPTVLSHREQTAASGTVERVALDAGGVAVPVLLFVPPHKPEVRPPVVVAVAQGGKAGFLKYRSEQIAELLKGGSAVCLVDVRGTGETRPADDARRYNGSSTELSQTEWVLGQTLVGSRLRDVRMVLNYLRRRGDLDAGRVVLWGDSFAAVNAADAELAVPLGVDKAPIQAEPLGGLLALFAALFEDDVRAVYVHGGLTGYHALLQSPFVYVPHDAMVPAALTAGDLCDVAAALVPRPLRLEALVDGLNRAASAKGVAQTYEPTRASYRAAGAESRLHLGDAAGELSSARWLLRQLVTSP